MGLQEFYFYLENNYRVERHFTRLEKMPSVDTLTPEEVVILSHENIVLTFKLIDKIRGNFRGEQNTTIAYFSNRIETVTNIHLLAKYANFLLWLTEDKCYAQQAIDYYLEVIDYYAEKEFEHKGLYFSDLLNVILSIASEYKLSLEIIKGKISSLINSDFLTSHEKLFVFEAINNEEDDSWSIKQRRPIYTEDEYKAFTQLCFSFADNEDCSERDRERYLLQGLEFAKRSNDGILAKMAYNLLAESEYRYIKPIDKENPAVAHQNEGRYLKIIKYYKLSGNKAKEKNALKELRKNNNYLRFSVIKFEEAIPDPESFKASLDKHFNSMLDCTPSTFVNRLCFCHKELLLPTYDALSRSVETNLKDSTLSLFTIRILDINRNSRVVSAEENTSHFIFNTLLNNFGMRFLLSYIRDGIIQKKISYSIIKRQLLKTSFGFEYYAKRGDEEITYNWFSLADEGFKEFFKQSKRGIGNKKYNLQLSIETLTLKFEAILRDIVSLLDGVITRVYNGNASLVTLEQLLDSEVLYKIFDDNDILLFRQVFTKKGYNIRNNVAHGFYKKEDYSISNAILVFICVLRLNKFTLYKPT